MDRTDGPLSARFRRVFRLVGVENGNRVTAHSCLYFISGFVNIAYLAFIFGFTDCNRTKVAHFIVLQYFYIGTLWTVVYKSDDIMWIARECDRTVGLRGDRIEYAYAEVTEQEKTSAPTKGMRLICIIACIICTWTCVEPFVNACTGRTELELPFTGTNDNIKQFVAIYLLQCSLMFITACFCIVIFQTLMGTALNLVVKYKVIGLELSRLNEQMLNDRNVYRTDLYQNIRKSVQSHHHILRYYLTLNHVVMSIILYEWKIFEHQSREEPDLGTIPHIIAELSYMGFFCYILNQLEEENDNLKNAVYNGEWAWMPKQATSALRIIMLRTAKRPHVILVRGGGPANLETFYKLLNGTCGYIIFGLVLDQAAF